MPDFIARAGDAETQAAAKLMGAVLWDDLAFEREFYMVPRDTYKTIPAARSFADIPFDRWRELGVDGLVMGSVERTGPAAFRVEVRLFDVRSRRSVMAKEYTGATSNPRLYAHTASDDIHLQQRALRGAARSKLTFSSDRDGERVINAIAERDVKEIYIADYDGANQQRVTVTRKLNIFPRWAPDARSIAYTSFRRDFPDIFISLIYQGTLENPTNGRGQNWLPAWSPDGTRLCFTSTRDGNSELYVMNRDGSNLVRLTNNPAIDTSPTWSPSGTQIAFTSDRSGSPQIYIIDADGLNLNKITAESWCDRPTWSSAPFNEIAYASRTGPGYDIRIYRSGHAGTPPADVGPGQQREPRVCAERPARGVHVDADGQEADLRDGAGRAGAEADHDGREQLHARLVEVVGAGKGQPYAHPIGIHRTPHWHRHGVAGPRGLCAEEAARGAAAAAAAAHHA